ncbi:aminopeptidase O [Crotalus adamanteus]|uniref:Aminopeptidase O n=1 Tax=Crotalus adamanteus TaxID=8729 RepID=A0AAW1C0T9_CROAD
MFVPPGPLASPACPCCSPPPLKVHSVGTASRASALGIPVSYCGCGQADSGREHADAWSLEIRKAGITLPKDFPRAIRIWYKTKPEGQSLSWTTDQSDRPCVYTVGSPINNRALFPCQEPPVAMSTWQATVRADACFVVLMSGENVAEPAESEKGILSWFYYVTMPMPASTFAIAVGCWAEVKRKSYETDDLKNDLSSKVDVRLLKKACGHTPYPCRFQDPTTSAQVIIPHRIFAPLCLKESCKKVLFHLLPQCLSAAYDLLGTHPFSRLDVLIVPLNFSSLGMASPHIIFLSQSTLSGESSLCGTRLCHEIAHAWFGLAIGARDWTEEWLSEGFATHLEDAFWSAAQKLSVTEAKEQQELKTLLRWHRLMDEVQNSEGDLQVLRPNKEKTGKVTESGSSVVKHGLNAEKIFMQVHYLKGYFLLRTFTEKIGEAAYFAFLRKYVQAFHGQLILSQEFLHLLLEEFPQLKGYGLAIENIFQKWLDCSGIPKESEGTRRPRLKPRASRAVERATEGPPPRLGEVYQPASRSLFSSLPPPPLPSSCLPCVQARTDSLDAVRAETSAGEKGCVCVCVWLWLWGGGEREAAVACCSERPTSNGAFYARQVERGVEGDRQTLHYLNGDVRRPEPSLRGTFRGWGGVNKADRAGVFP